MCIVEIVHVFYINSQNLIRSERTCDAMLLFLHVVIAQLKLSWIISFSSGACNSTSHTALWIFLSSPLLLSLRITSFVFFAIFLTLGLLIFQKVLNKNVTCIALRPKTKSSDSLCVHIFECGFNKFQRIVQRNYNEYLHCKHIIRFEKLNKHLCYHHVKFTFRTMRVGFMRCITTNRKMFFSLQFVLRSQGINGERKTLIPYFGSGCSLIYRQETNQSCRPAQTRLLSWSKIASLTQNFHQKIEIQDECSPEYLCSDDDS